MAKLPELFDLSGRVAVVTGGAGLLGEQFCRTLAEAGAAVMVADLDASAAQKLASQLAADGFQALAAPTDVTEPDSVEEMVAHTLESYQRLDILVNSAALDPKFDPQHRPQASNAFEDYSLEAWNAALKVDLTGIFL
jgi:NAD(P)-dependent dehydrogenase (short-subunit alcohol dehydrogenase family)